MNQFTPWPNCWRTERIGEVINKEALSIDRATFLATHVPMRKIAYERSPKQINQTSEDALLAELNTQSEADQHLFAVVKGIPGTGKSHLIRWLKEQYTTEHPNDAVLLIERANTSLRSTIQQIIDSQLFEPNDLPNALKRLQGAVDVLNQETLSERLLNSLQEATTIFSWEDVRQRLEQAGHVMHRRVTQDKISHFLLDHQVRQHLSRPDGPIERITTFLTAGSNNAMGIEQIPGFVESDCDFDVDILRKLRTAGGYRDVFDFCNDLQQKVEIRESLTRFLNLALHTYAISTATQLAAGDLRSMFNDLRRYLRQRGKSLSLFIEDITAFTGIDEGLVEVLVTQHRGESNIEFCRLLSVIGITDSYFADRFPDNIKERITHQLTLNADGVRNESDLLKDEETLVEFAARYLNAMRATPQDLLAWSEHGARHDSLPNACNECPVRQVCHTAFGTVKLASNQTGYSSQTVGLYPFNHKAISTLYSFLKEGISKTPRTFLNSLLAYILQSHSDKIESDEFPPPATDLANDITLPTFNPIPHLRLIQEQAGTQAKRIESLLLFWGGRNAFSQERDGVRYIGGVPSDVFGAFRLKNINGVPEQSPSQVKEAEAVKSPSLPQVAQASPLSVSKSSNPASAVVESRYTERIDAWANGGKLFAYDRFTDWIADLIRSYIDWQAHGVSSTQVTDNVIGSRFAIEDQSGAIQKGRNHLLFKRTNELRFVLQALADLNDSAIELGPSQLSEHLLTLSIWIRSQEQKIVEFVREPTLQLSEPGVLTQILIRNCVALACLSGELTAASLNDPHQLYRELIASCTRSTKETWNAKLQNLSNPQTADWRNLMRSVNTGDAVHTCRDELLQLLNRPQGTSTNVRFLDAATVWQSLATFSSEEWSFTPLPFQLDTNDRTWLSAVKVYETLQKGFKSVLERVCVQIDKQRSQLCQYLGNESISIVFKEIQELLTELGPVISYSSDIRGFFVGNDNEVRSKVEELEKLLQQTGELLAHRTVQERATHLSEHYQQWSTSLVVYSEQFEKLWKLIEKQNQKLTDEIKKMSAQSAAEEKYGQVVQLFDDMKAALSPWVTKESAK